MQQLWRVSHTPQVKLPARMVFARGSDNATLKNAQDGCDSWRAKNSCATTDQETTESVWFNSFRQQFPDSLLQLRAVGGHMHDPVVRSVSRGPTLM